MKKIFNMSSYLVLKALLRGDEDITALNGGRYLTTRIANIINGLRDAGVQIETEIIRAGSKKWYGRYKLIQTEHSIRKATEILEQIEAKIEDWLCILQAKIIPPSFWSFFAKL